jgi:hypothetical protein
MPEINLVHHGIFFDGYLMGCVTYRFPLMRWLNWNESSNRPASEDDSPVETKKLSAGDIVEVARICVGVDMPNLASAGFARSVEKFVTEYARPNGIRVLLTFVREGYGGSMIAALADKGWSTDGIRQGKQAGNRRELEIRDADKTRWFYTVDRRDYRQTTIGIQSTAPIREGGSL